MMEREDLDRISTPTIRRLKVNQATVTMSQKNETYCGRRTTMGNNVLIIIMMVFSLRLIFSFGLVNHSIAVINSTSQYYLIFLFDLVIISSGIRGMAFTRPPPLLILLALTYGYAATSAIWSSELVGAATKSLIFVVTSISAFTIGRVLSIQNVWRGVFLSLSVVVPVSLFFVLIAPDIGIETRWPHAGKWIGIFAHKNLLGITSALASIVFVWAWKSRMAPRSMAAIGFLLSITLVIGSQSRTAMAVLGLGGIVVWALREKRKRGGISAPYVVPLICIAFSGYVIFPPLYDTYFSNNVSQLSTTLESRFDIWTFIVNNFAESPILGSGMAGFWNEQNTLEFYAQHGWVIPNPHSGYLLALVEFGLIGMLLYLALIVAAVYSILWRIRTQSESQSIWAYKMSFAFLLMFVLANFVETLSFRSTNAWQYLFTVIFVGSVLPHRVSAGSHARRLMPNA